MWKEGEKGEKKGRKEGEKREKVSKERSGKRKMGISSDGQEVPLC